MDDVKLGIFLVLGSYKYGGAGGKMEPMDVNKYSSMAT